MNDDTKPSPLSAPATTAPAPIHWLGDATQDADVWELTRRRDRFTIVGGPTTLYFATDDGTRIVVPSGYWLYDWHTAHPRVSSAAPAVPVEAAPSEARFEEMVDAAISRYRHCFVGDVESEIRAALLTYESGPRSRAEGAERDRDRAQAAIERMGAEAYMRSKSPDEIVAHIRGVVDSYEKRTQKAESECASLRRRCDRLRSRLARVLDFASEDSPKTWWEGDRLRSARRGQVWSRAALSSPKHASGDASTKSGSALSPASDTATPAKETHHG